jgi:hypothetical protein
MGIFVAWIVFCFVAGIVAASRDRNPVGWFFVALVFSPLVAIVLLLCLGTSGLTCPACRETVKHGASICKHCRTPLEQNAAAEASEARDVTPVDILVLPAMPAATPAPKDISEHIKQSAGVFGGLTSIGRRAITKNS